jgi:hypothetical protein
MRPGPLAVPLACAVCGCAVPELGLMPRYGRVALEGEFGASSGSTSARSDVERAGLGEEEDVLHGRADLDLGSPHLILSGMGPSFEGRGTLDATIDDGTDTINAGATVDSEADIGIYDGLVVFDLVPGDTLDLALGIGGSVVDLDLAFEEVGAGTTIETAETFLVPVVAALAGVELGRLELQLLGLGIDASYEGDSILYWTGEGFLSLRLLGTDVRASLVGGYRISQIEVDYDDENADIDADLRLSGPFVGLELAV